MAKRNDPVTIKDIISVNKQCKEDVYQTLSKNKVAEIFDEVGHKSFRNHPYQIMLRTRLLIFAVILKTKLSDLLWLWWEVLRKWNGGRA